ncbi:hypothetical protein [Pseudoalteromonas arctica]|uniref:Uncharacterized protein n=1 Tax=Pseudoalteromonas arctica TaxID=394751 RepID=A0A7Y0DW78_9GAMM|nr:hypothetical protein [Pseudoalteromonas arctica]NMM42663.1 hypothetical protein [Pseudoalteromonas arctica]
MIRSLINAGIMIPSKKISQTVLEFGKSIIAGLPASHTKEEFEATMKLVVTAWNAVVMDSWENGSKFELELLALMETAPKIVKLEIKRLIKRKKTKFYNDPRAVDDFWVRENNGEIVFGCEARLNVDNAPASNTKH